MRVRKQSYRSRAWNNLISAARGSAHGGRVAPTKTDEQISYIMQHPSCAKKCVKRLSSCCPKRDRACPCPMIQHLLHRSSHRHCASPPLRVVSCPTRKPSSPSSPRRGGYVLPSHFFLDYRQPEIEENRRRDEIHRWRKAAADHEEISQTAQNRRQNAEYVEDAEHPMTHRASEKTKQQTEDESQRVV